MAFQWRGNAKTGRTARRALSEERNEAKPADSNAGTQGHDARRKTDAATALLHKR